MVAVLSDFHNFIRWMLRVALRLCVSVRLFGIESKILDCF